MLESKAYKTYYAYASGEKNPKPKYVRKKSDSDTSLKKKPAQATKDTRLKTSAKVAKSDKKKQPAKMPKTKGLAVLSESKVPDDQQQKVTGTNEGAGVTPEVPDVPRYDSESEEESWMFSQDDDDAEEESDMNDDSEETESDNDEDDFTHLNLLTYQADDQEEEKDDEDEMYSDQRVSTPPDYKLTNEDENIEGDDKDKEGEQEQEEEDDLYRDVNINLERSDVEMTDTYVTLTWCQSSLILLRIQFDQRVSTLETKMSKFKQINQFAEAVSSIPGIVDTYLASRMKDAVDVAVLLQSNKLKEESQAENQEFLNKVDSTIKEIITEQVQAQVSKFMPQIEKHVTESLETEVLVRSTNQPQMSYSVAASLSKFKLKKILIDKMETNKSMNN
ncbi:hypothetical protein Tco_0931924 [Tanacetum coccineum]